MAFRIRHYGYDYLIICLLERLYQQKSLKLAMPLLLSTSDIAAAEATVDSSSDDKTIDDNAKLLRQGKDILDISIEQHAVSTMVGIVIQLDGFQRQLSSAHLDEDGVYVSLPRHFDKVVASRDVIDLRNKKGFL